MFIAGRIEFLGKHTDYCGGRSLVCAIERGFSVNFTPREDSLIVVKKEDTGEEIIFEIAEDLETQRGHWANYPMTAVKRLAQNFKSRQLKGANINFQSDLPQASGLSSSSAFIIAVFQSLASVNSLENFPEYQENISDDLGLAEYLGCVENGYDFRNLKGSAGVGTFGGSQDQTAILCCRKNYLSRFSFAPVKFEKDIYLPSDYCFAIASSGVTAEKTGAAMAKYNRISLMVSEIVKLWRGTEQSLAQIIENTGFAELEKFIAENDFSFEKADLQNRIKQFYIENFEIIPKISELLEADKIDEIGELINMSHQNADRFLQNQTPETNFLQISARKIGATASSAFGAGFGGSVYALLKKSDAENFISEWRKTYLKNFLRCEQKSEFFITETSKSKFD